MTQYNTDLPRQTNKTQTGSITEQERAVCYTDTEYYYTSHTDSLIG